MPAAKLRVRLLNNFAFIQRHIPFTKRSTGKFCSAQIDTSCIQHCDSIISTSCIMNSDQWECCGVAILCINIAQQNVAFQTCPVFQAHSNGLVPTTTSIAARKWTAWLNHLFVCSAQLAECLENPSCAANIACLNTCNGRPDETECQVRQRRQEQRGAAGANQLSMWMCQLVFDGQMHKCCDPLTRWCGLGLSKFCRLSCFQNALVLCCNVPVSLFLCWFVIRTCPKDWILEHFSKAGCKSNSKT